MAHTYFKKHTMTLTSKNETLNDTAIKMNALNDTKSNQIDLKNTKQH